MGEPHDYDQYPAWMVLASNVHAFTMYLAGAIILYQLGLIWPVLYVLFILFLEFRLVRGHCVDCWYYGKTCAFGKGRLSSLFFPKGTPEYFSRRQITKKDLVPDFLVLFIPLVVGSALLLLNFSWILLILVIALVILGSAGNAVVRGQMACRYCRQKEIGCPAQRLFERPEK
jgi:hypothetical protein